MFLSRYLRAAGDVVLPRTCVVCGCRLYIAERHICLGCRMDMPLTRYWERSHNPMADKFNEKIQEKMMRGCEAGRNGGGLPAESESGVAGFAGIAREQSDEAWYRNRIGDGQIREGYGNLKGSEWRNSGEGEVAGQGRIEDIRNSGIQGERYAYAAALFFYHKDAEYKRIPYHIKYQGDIATGRFFGRMLGEKLSGSSLWSDVDVIIPVPLHWTRRWKRGYNQAEVIAEAVAEAMGVPLRSDILRRRRKTQTQVKLSVEQKGKNVDGAFEVTEKMTGVVFTDECSPADSIGESDSRNQSERGSKNISGVDSMLDPKTGMAAFRHILLVDDVFTTGSTLEACHYALRKVFPPSVRISVATLGYLES